MAEHRIRADGWTAERQAAFLAALAGTRSVTAAAQAAGMSRESAHRLRNRRNGALFAHLWDLALAPTRLRPRESHTTLFTDGQLARLLGNHYRRERGDFLAPARQLPGPARGDRTSTS
jgi:hypothetical protein